MDGRSISPEQEGEPEQRHEEDGARGPVRTAPEEPADSFVALGIRASACRGRRQSGSGESAETDQARNYVTDEQDVVGRNAHDGRVLQVELHPTMRVGDDCSEVALDL